MRKKLLFGLAGSLVVLLVVGGLFASNMGFKLNYVLLTQGAGSASGKSTIALPFNQQTDLLDANDLLIDIGGTAIVNQLQRFDPVTDGVIGYTGVTGTPFGLVPGEAYIVQLKLGVPTQNYIIVGSHDPGRVITFDGPGNNGSASGRNFYAYPYHSTSADAGQLITELGGTALINQIITIDRATDGVIGYTGVTGTAFPLVPGEGYFVQLKLGVTSISFIPSHY